MKNFCFHGLCLSAFATMASAQASLLFTPSARESTRSGSNGTALATITNRAIAFVTPNAALTQSAEVFVPALAFQTFAGDEDANGTVYAPNLMDAIDAVLVMAYDWDGERGARVRQAPVDALSCYVSPNVDVGTNVSGAPGLRAGDCGRFVRTAAGNGQVSYFIRAEQIIQACGLFNTVTGNPLTPADIDLDAITVSVDRHIFLSLDGDHSARLQVPGAGLVSMLVTDGAVLCIPAPTWTPNARGEVANVLPQRAIVVLNEAQVSALAVNATVADAAGALAAPVIDTEGLALDPNGGAFNMPWGNQVMVWPNLLISAESFTGGGVMSTVAGGQIAVVNGSPLARTPAAGPTQGQLMGMALVAGSYLGALESLAQEPCWFVTGSGTPNGLGGAVDVVIGTNIAAPFAFLGLGLGALPVSPSISFAPWAPNSPCFPELYPTVLGNPFLAIALAAGAGNARFGAVSFPATAPVAPGVLFQAVTLAGGSLHLSTPITLN